MVNYGKYIFWFAETKLYLIKGKTEESLTFFLDGVGHRFSEFILHVLVHSLPRSPAAEWLYNFQSHSQKTRVSQFWHRFTWTLEKAPSSDFTILSIILKECWKKFEDLRCVLQRSSSRLSYFYLYLLVYINI